MENKALVIFSGGQDSTTCLYWALREFDVVETVTFDYGQRHRNELEAAHRIAANAGVPFRIMKLGLLNQLTENALTREGIVPDIEKPAGTPPNTLVEGRNMLFLTFAAVYAKSKGIRNLVTGVGQADYSGYPDCRNDFIVSLNQTLNLSMDYEYKIHTPLMWKNKAEIWQLADELGVFEIVRYQTVTCYYGMLGDGCGSCPSCKLRENGLKTYLKIKQDGKS
jgi:7-cyano-7-deazaguanine synthase